MSVDAPGALVVGADRPFGREILWRLARDGYRLGGAADGILALLVVNAPVTLDDVRFDDVTDAAFDDALTEQLYAPVAAVQTAMPRMTEGSSVVIVTGRGHLGGWGGAHQMAAGAALAAMARSMALELAEVGIRVNCIATDWVGAGWDTPPARADIAAAVAFLGGRESRLVSGEMLLLDEARSLTMRESVRR